jgi:hypothetical protein
MPKRSGTAARTFRTPASRVQDRPEQNLQLAEVEWFRLAVRCPQDGILLHIPNGERRAGVAGAILSGISLEDREKLPEQDKLMPFGMGLLPGAFDLVLILPQGRTLWIENKAPAAPAIPGKRSRSAGSLSAPQKRLHAATIALGHTVVVVTSVEGFCDALEAAGVPLRYRPWGPG